MSTIAAYLRPNFLRGFWHRFSGVTGVEATNDDLLLGTFKGVYLPCVLGFFSVVLFLRLGWVLGCLGLFEMFALILLSFLIIFLTCLSIAATATNMDVKGGGAYYMISRCFGIEIGSAIGVPLFIAQALGVSFSIAGFSESLCTLFPQLDCQITNYSSLAVFSILIFFSSRFAMKFQVAVFGLLALGLISLFLGYFFPSSLPIINVAESEFVAPSLSFWAAFAIFFPAVTGIENGVALSGQLKEPKKSLPVGAIWAVITAFVVFSAITLLFESQASLEHLVRDPLLMQKLALFGGLIPITIWSTILINAIGGLLGAPRTLQALAKDRIVPTFIGREFGPLKEPRIAILVTCLIAFYGLSVGSLNTLASILSMFFLMAYATLNLAAGIESLISNPSWRPTFHLHWGISFAGAGLCFIGMFMISPGYTFIAIFLTSLLYYLLTKRHMHRKWDDMLQGIVIFLVRFGLFRLAESPVSFRSWRPHFLVFSGSPSNRPYLIDFASSITQGKGFLYLSSVIAPKEGLSHELLAKKKRIATDFLKKRGSHAFVEFALSSNPMQGIQHSISGHRFGPLSPNTILLGDTSNRDHYKDFVGVIRCCKQNQKNIVIIREDVQANGVPTLKKSSDQQRVDIWWDDDSKDNSTLLLLMAHMLQADAHWSECDFVLKTTAPNEFAKKERLEFFKTFLSLNRLNLDVNVLVIPEADSKITSTVCCFSHDASLVLMGLRFPHSEELDETYSDYYHQQVRSFQRMPTMAFVACCQTLPLES